MSGGPGGRAAGRWAAAALLLAAAAGLMALGIWQLHRRISKLALIAQVEHRLAAAPVAPPPPARWPAIGAGDAYTRIAARGVYRRGADSLVQAVTDAGGGFWLLTPLATDRGFTLLVNRGFIAADRRADPPPPPPGPVAVGGLLRLSEPGGGFLRANDPGHDHWYSRDVAAIARRRGLGRVAPYFVDADAATSPGVPRGGLTVIRFANNHLQYAFTWFALAGLALAASLKMAFGRKRA